MYLRKVQIHGVSYAAAPTQVSTVFTPHAPEARNSGVKKGGVGGVGEVVFGDAAAAGEKQLESCAAGKMKYAAL
jgi:hypothetical protein